MGNENSKLRDEDNTLYTIQVPLSSVMVYWRKSLHVNLSHLLGLPNYFIAWIPRKSVASIGGNKWVAVS